MLLKLDLLAIVVVVLNDHFLMSIGIAVAKMVYVVQRSKEVGPCP